MKIALCLSGLAHGKNDIGRNSGGIKYSIEHFKEHLLDNPKYDVDVFVHSWSTDIKEEIMHLLNPKKSIIEEQITFQETPLDLLQAVSEEEKGKLIRSGADPNSVIGNYRAPKNTGQQTKSQLYSRKKSVDLKREYEVENNIEYDFVLMTRFDICFFTGFKFEEYDKNSFYHSNNTDFLYDGKKTKFNQALLYRDSEKRERLKKVHRNDFNRYGYLDHWFLSSSKIMDEFSKAFDYIEHYTKTNKNLCTHAGSIPCEKIVSLHLGKMKQLGTLNNTVAIKDRIEDYELVRRWYLDSIY